MHKYTKWYEEILIYDRHKWSYQYLFNDFLDLFYSQLSSLKISNKNNFRILIYLICVMGLWTDVQTGQKPNCVVKGPP